MRDTGGMSGTGIAPFFAADSGAPDGARAVWRQTRDGVRIRIGEFGRGPKGTVLCFPGRTEYIEKYGPTARDFMAAGYGFAAIDWRGQGLADRLLSDPRLGHVDRFADYQRDVAAFLAHAGEAGLPKPWFLLAHSMGGAIALQSLEAGLEVRAAAFSAPMWQVAMAKVRAIAANVQPGPHAPAFRSGTVSWPWPRRPVPARRLPGAGPKARLCRISARRWACRAGGTRSRGRRCRSPAPGPPRIH
ncbi:alpha/beta fold hydrolase [Mangrovicoccus ximenensis]|uniref:alpha/beta fold hydrolase n=1 Tax=Mangrovicoccus ximenensis TaxID=1911570 RepID=UPI001F48FCAA|nr:alpha/beta hydrolase [Mangrovicoccus ximenensis]